MTFTALTGALSHFSIGGIPDITTLIFCVLTTLIFARVAAKYANKAEHDVLNRISGVVLALIGSIILLVNFI